MKITATDLILLVYLMLTVLCSTTMEDEKQLSLNGKFQQTQKDTSNSKKVKSPNRQQRQTRHHNPPGLFLAVTSLLGGTVADTFTAYRNVSRLISIAFAPPKTTTVNATTPTNTTSFTLRQALALLGRNYRGLRRLFDNEFARALNESEKNVKTFRNELKGSAKMFLEYTNRNIA